MRIVARVIISLLTVISLISLYSCKSDGYDLGVSSSGYGTVVSNSTVPTNQYYIEHDNGSNLYISVNTIPGVLVRNGDRIFANFTLLGEVITEKPQKDYYVRLSGLYRIVSKQAVPQSELDRDEELKNEIGDDPVKVERAVFSGRYMNINFKFLGSRSPERKHFINLIYDDVSQEQGKIVLRMVRNGYTDVPTNENHEGFGYHSAFMSFEISPLLPEGVEEIEVVLMWSEYGVGDSWWSERIEKKIEGVYRPVGQEEQSEPRGEYNVDYEKFE